MLQLVVTSFSALTVDRFHIFVDDITSSSLHPLEIVHSMTKRAWL